MLTCTYILLCKILKEIFTHFTDPISIYYLAVSKLRLERRAPISAPIKDGSQCYALLR